MKGIGGWLVRFALPPMALFAIVVLAWDRVVAIWDLKPYLLPSPAAVVRAAIENAGRLRIAATYTATGALCGFTASLVMGTLVALVFSQSRVIQRSMYPYAIFLQTVPIVAIAPLVIIWFGYGFRSVVVVAFIISLFPIITNTTTGLTSIDPSRLELFDMYNASRWQVLVKLRLPSAVPYVVAGAKVSCGLAIIGTIVGEIFVGFSTQSFGLGYLITGASDKSNTAYLFAAVITSTLLGVAVFALVSIVGNTILARWHTQAPSGK